ncbi:hypothetical protein GCM10011586_29130 [Silvibacterium dinghuense]|nr:hypothetical protein GCM10011586_29130 [Silvibacterium dinghuense]
MQRLSTTPAFREKVLEITRSVPKIGGWLSPSMVELLRSAILGKDWQRVDHFPAFTIGALNKSVDVTMRVAGDSFKQFTVKDLIDLGAYDPGKAATVDLDQPVDHPTYAEDPAMAVSHPAPGLTMGDGPDPALAPMHAESTRLAEVLNRLSLNTPHSPQLTVRLNGQNLTDPGALIKELQVSGYQVTVDDDLYFANFGHLHDGARDVMMPFWLDSQIAVPATRRSLLVPVSHSEHELHVRGPHLNADVSYYFGIDGKSEFRTMDSLNQAWVMHRVAFTYTGDRAEEAINLLAEATRVYLAVHLAHPELPFGGYYKLGVCQDINAALEQRLQDHVILFPLTRDLQYFPADPAQLHLDPRDGEFLRLLHQIPNDRGNARPAVDRVLGALPTNDPAAILIPGLGNDILRVERARALGLIKRTNPLLTATLISVLVLLLVSAILWAAWRTIRTKAHN